MLTRDDLTIIWDNELTHEEWLAIAQQEFVWPPEHPKCAMCSRKYLHLGPCVTHPIKQLIDAAIRDGGGTVYFPPGTYQIGNQIIEYRPGT